MKALETGHDPVSPAPVATRAVGLGVTHWLATRRSELFWATNLLDKMVFPPSCGKDPPPPPLEEPISSFIQAFFLWPWSLACIQLMCIVRSVFLLRMAVDYMFPCAFRQVNSAVTICIVKVH